MFSPKFRLFGATIGLIFLTFRSRFKKETIFVVVFIPLEEEVKQKGKLPEIHHPAGNVLFFLNFLTCSYLSFLFATEF